MSKLSGASIAFGLSEPSLNIHCQEMTFRVHREVISQASEVWNEMLNGGFAESISENISLPEDDPAAIELALQIIYSLLSGSMNASTFYIDHEMEKNIKIVSDKYALNGVSSFLQLSRKLQEDAAALQCARSVEQCQLFKIQELRKKSKMGSGMLVNYFDRPPLGTRVIENNDGYRRSRVPPLTGTIIDNNEDSGTEIGVRWDDGTESHNLHCNKKGHHELRYL